MTPSKCKEPRKGDYHRSYYGYWMTHDKFGYLHRKVYAETNNHVFKEGELVRHTCDNRWCIEPTHLLIGNKADNMNDAYERGRLNQKRGKNSNAVLTEDSVQEIRDTYAAKQMTQKALAEEFGVSQSTISLIISRRIWP